MDPVERVRIGAALVADEGPTRVPIGKARIREAGHRHVRLDLVEPAGPVQGKGRLVGLAGVLGRPDHRVGTTADQHRRAVSHQPPDAPTSTKGSLHHVVDRGDSRPRPRPRRDAQLMGAVLRRHESTASSAVAARQQSS